MSDEFQTSCSLEVLEDQEWTFLGSRKASWNLLDEKVEDPSPDFLRPNEERLFARTILDRVGTRHLQPS